MAVYKRGAVYWYDFQFKGVRYSGTTRLRNKTKAELFESKKKTDLAMGEVGLATPKTAPFLRDFLATDGQFLNHVRLKSKGKPKTVKFYEQSAIRLLEFAALADTRLNLIDTELLEKFVQWRAKQKRRRHGDGLVSVITINRQLAGLRRALKLAHEWGYIAKPILVRLLPGEARRDYVLSGDIEKRYLAVAPSPLKEAAILMLDLGIRPEECVNIRKADLSVTALFIPEGKTPNSRRTIPIPERSRKTIDFLCRFWPDSEWLFPGRRKGRHLTVWALEQFHRKIRKETVDEEGRTVFPKEFVIYSFRHTFGTRLGESDGNPYTIMVLMGHASLKISERYVHPSRNQVSLAMKRKEAFDKMLLEESSTSKIHDTDICTVANKPVSD